MKFLSKRGAFLVIFSALLWIFETVIIVNGFHFSTVMILGQKVNKNNSQLQTKTLSRRRNVRQNVPEEIKIHPNTPKIKEKKQIVTIAPPPESSLIINHHLPNYYDDKKEQLEFAEKIILQYLSSFCSKNNNNHHQRTTTRKGVGEFHLYGWRWHTMSLIRETNRLQKLASQFQKKATKSSLSSLSTSTVNDDDIAKLRTAVEYVVGFNLKGMTRVENEVMIPFLRKQLIEQHHTNNDNVLQRSFDTIIDHLELEQQYISQIGYQLIAAVAEEESKQVDFDLLLDDIIEMANKILIHAQALLERKNNVIIPAMTHLVPAHKQRSTISKIMSSLGVLDSRLHLVGFHEAIKDNKVELKLWNENIPFVARKVIHLWKQTQYDPKASVLLLQDEL